MPDLVSQAAHVGDLHHAVVAHLMKSEHIPGELGAVIVGKAPLRTNKEEIIIFDSTGTALQDAAAAATAYEKAVALGRGDSIAFWD